MNVRRLIRKTCKKWDTWTSERLNDLKSFYKQEDHYLDFRSTGFIKSEVYKADECIYIEHENKIIGFMFLFTSKRPRALYITLMVSFQKGVGSDLIQFVDKNLIYPHEYIALRATFKSVGFFIKKGFKIFDFISLEDYVNGNSDNNMTQNISENISNIKKLVEIQNELVIRDWMPQFSSEFPLLKRRNTPVLNLCRQSKRINLR